MMQALDFPHLSQGRELDMLLGTDADLDFLTSGSFMMPDSNSLTGTYTGPMASSPDQGLGLDPASLPSMQGVRGLQLTGLPPVVSLPMEQQQACGAGAGGGAGATTANQTGGAWLGQDMLGPLLGQPKPGQLARGRRPLPAGSLGSQAAPPAHQHSSSSDDSRTEDLLQALNGKSKAMRKQEQNRQAQQRHRAKAKVKQQEQQQEMQALQQQLREAQRLNETLTSRTALLEKALVLRGSKDPQPPKQPLNSGREMVSFSPGMGWNPNAFITVTVMGPKPQLWTLGELADMSIEEHKQTYKAFVNRFAELLAEANGQERSPAGREIEGTVTQFGVWAAAATYDSNAIKMRQLLYGKLEEGARDSAPLTQLVAHLHFTQDQQGMILAARRRYLRAVTPLLNERRRICSLLNQVAQEQTQTAEDAALSFVAAAKASQLMQEMLTQEMAEWKDFKGDMYGRCLTPMQVAEAQVLAYPRAMDMVGLADAVALLAGEPDCQSLCSRRDSFMGLCDSIKAICPPGQSCFLEMVK